MRSMPLYELPEVKTLPMFGRGTSRSNKTYVEALRMGGFVTDIKANP
jgi:hypothetical protein